MKNGVYLGIGWRRISDEGFLPDDLLSFILAGL
jgi:hypothetical protein